MGRIVGEAQRHEHKYSVTLWSDETFDDGHETKTFGTFNVTNPVEMLEAIKKVVREMP